jgi:precorrin-2 dehydrogenase / sirohydrochlorin ferrochelatase
VYMVGSTVRCLVVGGGNVAERKADALLDAGATVTVASPNLTARLSSQAHKGAIVWKRGKYRASHLKGSNLVIGATNDAGVNERVFIDAQRLGIPVNIVDDPAHCTFIVPSVFRKGPFQVAVSTGGAAPLLAARLRREFEKMISDELMCMADELGKMRPQIKRLDAQDKERFWNSVLSLRVSSYKGKPGLLKQGLHAEMKKHSKIKKLSGGVRKIGVKR